MFLLDTGGSQDIIDGKIKLKTGSNMKEFTENGLTFEDGSMLDADVVVFATGWEQPTSVEGQYWCLGTAEAMEMRKTR